MKHFYLKSFLLCVFPFFCIAVFAYDFKSDGIYYNITSKEDLTVAVTNNNSLGEVYEGSVTIPEIVVYDGKKYRVTSIGENAFSGCTGLISINIPNSVTSIDYEGFSGCKALTSINIPESVKKIGVFAFAHCSGLRSLTIPNGVTTIEGGAFANCSGLVSVTIPPSATSIATGGGEQVFDGCSNLKSVYITDLAAWCNIHFDYPQDNPLFYAHHLYLDGKEITNVSIPHSVTSIGNAVFAGFEGLTAVTIPNNVISIGAYAFYDCTGLTTVPFPNSVTSIGESAFSGCTGLTSVRIPNSVTSIDYEVFAGCSGLTSVVIPESVTEIKVSAFSGCSGLTSVIIPNNVTIIGGGAFNGCSGLTSVTSLNTTPPTISAFSSTFDESTEKSAVLDVPVGCKSKYASHPYWGKFTNITEEGMSDESIIKFVDPLVKAICVRNWDTNGDGELSRKEAAAVEHFSSVFSDNPNITSFNELLYFTGLTTIDFSAFSGCSGLTSVIIPNSVTSIGNRAFDGCSGLTSVTIPNSVTSIGNRAFDGCSGLTSVTIPNSVTSIGYSAFYRCSGLTSVTIPNGITSISEDTFCGCSGLTSVIIPNGVTSIGGGAFWGCTGLTSISIPNSVTSIDDKAFRGCSGLTSLTIEDGTGTLSLRNSEVSNPFMDCPLEKLHLGRNLDYKTRSGWTYYNSISFPFEGKEKLTSLTIGDSVTSIGDRAFSGCSGLTSVTIPNSVTSIGYSAFDGCSGLTSVTIPNSVTSIGVATFWGCCGLTSLFIPNSVTSIGGRAFEGCDGLTSITIPNSVTSIGDYAFYGCRSASITLPDDIISIDATHIYDYYGERYETHAFNGVPAVYVKKGTRTMFTLWGVSYNTPYETGTKNVLSRPYVEVSTTQTTATFKLKNFDSEFAYTLGGDEFTGSELIKTGLRPETSETLRFCVYWSGYQGYSKNVEYKTANISPSFSVIGKTASSISVQGSYIHGDALVLAQWLEIDGIEYAGDKAFVSGLEPDGKYNVKYNVKVSYGETGSNMYVYTSDRIVLIEPLTLITSQPKVISPGNVIVAAVTNLDDEETNVGFEWRRTDWTDDFASNTGDAALYAGTMEGYIRNLNTEKLWKFRPYYLSNSGTYYYGDWIGVDPTNTSYFSPTVHTYTSISVTGNTALLKGYALGGTDAVTVQGFMYWKNVSGGEAQRRAISIPTNAKTVVANGQVMTAELIGLDYNSEYTYVAFVETVTGEIFYGEEQTFTTGEDPTDIEEIEVENVTNEPVIEIARYNMNGQKIDTPQKGINIIRYSNGTTRSVYVK